MTVFSRTWNASYEASPSDTDDASEGANRIRDFKTDIRERDDVEHYAGVTDGTEQGTHKFPVGVTSARPTAASGRLYLNSETETLDFHDGTAWQVVGIPKATRMLFQQTAAPLGWTKDVTANLNDTALRIVTGAVGSEVAATAFSTIMATARASSNVDPGDTNGTVVTINGTNLNLASAATNLAITSGSTAITSAQLPSHKHLTYTRHAVAWEGDSYDDVNGTVTAATAFTTARQSTSQAAEYVYTQSVGSGSAHSHALGGTVGSHSHTLSGTTGSHAHVASSHIHSMPSHQHTTNMAINYHDVIICSKD